MVARMHQDDLIRFFVIINQSPFKRQVGLQKLVCRHVLENKIFNNCPHFIPAGNIGKADAGLGQVTNAIGNYYESLREDPS